MKKTRKPPMRRGVVAAVILVSIALLLWFAVAMLPGGYSEDLGRIGQGRPVAVLVHNKNAIDSVNLMSMIDSLRDEYAGRVEFVLADVETRPGREFAERHQAGIAQLIVFGPRGRELDVARDLRDPALLRRALDESLRRP